MGQSVPFACQDWANTKAAYRFFSNDKVSEEDILTGHFQSTLSRATVADGPVLILHDTTEFSYQREKPALIGLIGKRNGGKDKAGDFKPRTVCGILMHSSLAVTTEGLPLGLTAIKFWSRKKFKGCNALKKKINPTRIPIQKKESVRWLDNLRQATELLDDVVFTSVIVKVTSMNFSARHKKWVRIFLSESVLTAWPETAIIRLPTK